MASHLDSVTYVSSIFSTTYFHCRTKLPAVHRHVESFRMPWAMVCSKWFVCLYRFIFIH